MAEQFYTKQLANGLTLLGQRMEGVSSLSMSLLIRGGAAYDPPDGEGIASVASEWMLRGAGEWDTRQLNNLLDSLGCQHDENVHSEHLHLSSAQLGRNFEQILAIYRQIVLAPRLEDATFEPCRQLTMQDLASLEDEPARKCNVLLSEKFYPYPLGRCTHGHQESLAIMRPKDAREHLLSHLTPHGAILAIAGDIDWDKFVAMAWEHFGTWNAPPPPEVRTMKMPTGQTHVRKETAQAHIGIAHPSVPLGHKMYYAARLAETVLSGGMGSRLFTEVREMRGLVYNVGCRYHSLKDHAGFFTYAGTRPEVAQQTLDVTLGEIRRMGEGVTEDEMARARTQLKSSLVMQGESTPARAHTLASDWYLLGRLRTLREISDSIDGVTAGEVAEYMKAFPPSPLTVLVIGPEALKL